MLERELRDEAVGLARDLIQVDTSNPPGRETPAALVLKEYLEANGIECELVARDPERANLIARIPGTGEGPSLALLGHTDVVPADAQD
jgi:acetylornithine deacetylase/succinyl-diaminopimelate desuccinylase-like protein